MAVILARHHPKGGAPDDGVLRRARDITPIGQRVNLEVELGFGLDARVAGRALGEERAGAGAEIGATFVAAALVDELALLGPVTQRLDVLDLHGTVELELRVEPGETVLLAREGDVVIGGEVLELDPALPGGGHRAVDARGLQLVKHLAHVVPGGQRGILGHARRVQHVAVDPENRGRGVERQRQHLTVGGGVIPLHRADIIVGIERHAGIGHHLIDRLNRALGGHHRRGADLEHHQDVGLLACTEGRDPGIERFRVVALVGRNDLVIALAGVEVLDLLIDQFTKAAREGVPELDLGCGLRGERRGQSRGRKRRTQCEILHVFLPVCSGIHGFFSIWSPLAERPRYGA